jgi:hypothetical protein
VLRNSIMMTKILKLDIQIFVSNLIIETDCLAVIEAFKEGSMDRSEVSIIANEFKLNKPPDRQVKLAKIHRKFNMIAHAMRQFSRREWSSGVLLSAVLTCASRSAWKDCNPNIIFKLMYNHF